MGIESSYPVQQVDQTGKVLAEFPSVHAAARHIGRSDTGIRRALEHGWRCGRFWWRHADIKHEHQPKLVITGPLYRETVKYKQPVIVDGVDYPNLGAAAKALGLKYRTLWMRLERRGSWAGSADVAMATTG